MYPALVAAQATLAQRPGTELAFAGSVGGFERPLVEQSGLPFARYHEIQAGPLHGVAPLRAVTSLARLMAGTGQALGLMRRERPDVVFSTGGWVSLPVALAAWLLRVPVALYLPDVEPGLTIKALSRFAVRVAVTMPESAAYFRPGQAVVTGYPLRPALLAATREAGLAHFGLDAARKTVLAFGGSTGARNINSAVIDLLPALLARGDTQVIHVIGERDWERAQAQLASLARPIVTTTTARTIISNAPLEGHAPAGYHPYRYLHDEMGLALAAADVVVNRSGASVLGELPHFGLPSVLVPYPYAWRYQKVNADVLVGRGAALLVEDARMATDLLPALNALLDDPARLSGMRAAARGLAQPDAAGRIAAILIQLAEGGTAA